MFLALSLLLIHAFNLVVAVHILLWVEKIVIEGARYV